MTVRCAIVVLIAVLVQPAGYVAAQESAGPQPSQVMQYLREGSVYYLKLRCVRLNGRPSD